jgi:four helix bundle protein
MSLVGCYDGSMQPYERFAAWRHCHELALAVYRITGRFPPEERFGLVSQARRAAFSAAANIVEGSAKRGRAEFRRFVDTSIGSLGELGYVFRFASELGMLEETDATRLHDLHEEASKTTWGLYRSLRSR